MARFCKLLYDLLTDSTFYVLPKLNPNGKSVYMLYRGNMIPVRYVTDSTFRKYKDLMKRNKKGRYTLNLSAVRQSHGNSLIKRMYKEYRNGKGILSG